MNVTDSVMPRTLHLIRRMIRADHLLYIGSDIILVRVGCIREPFQLIKERVRIKRNRLPDVDEIIFGLLETLLRHELLLVELLSRAKTGVLDLDVDVRLVAGQADQVLREVRDLDRAAHVKDEDLAAVRVGACQKDKADRLRDRHEVADDVRMGDRNRTALLNLLLEDRDDGTVGAQDVAEADGDELGFSGFEDAAGAVLVCIFHALVGENLRHLVGLAGLNLCVETLDDHLAEALGSPHDVGRVDSLVGTDEDEAAGPVDHGRVGGLVGAQGVVLDRFAGRILHERHVLVGGRVVDDVRMVVFKDFIHLPAVADGADQSHQIELRIFLTELELDVVCVIFVNVKDDELLR